MNGVPTAVHIEIGVTQRTCDPSRFASCTRPMRAAKICVSQQIATRMPIQRNAARIAALECLIGHFPNPTLTARGMEHRYGRAIVRELPRQLRRLREELALELRRLNSTNKTKRTS